MSRGTTEMETCVASSLLQQVPDYRQAVEREREAENFHPDSQTPFPFILAARADSGEGRYG